MTKLIATFIILTSLSVSAQEKPTFGEQRSESGIRHSFLITGNSTMVVSENSTVELNLKGNSRDGFVLPGGNVLVSMSNVAKEIDPKTMQVVWSYRLATENKELGTCVRLENGNTLVVERGVKPRLLEIAPNGSVVVEVPLQPENR